MATELMTRPNGTHEMATTTITDEQVNLIKQTVAKGATDVELQLYFYDCRRHGVHPLDKLIHFTKRSGKYTPITSIDLLRSRAGDTGELGGIDDAQYHGTPAAPGFVASVTVWRIVHGQRCPFSASARWEEYLPQEQFMWKKMPHLMLGKCAEGLALRKAFPKQLAGLYAKEEMEQGDVIDVTPEPAKTAATYPPREELARNLYAEFKRLNYSADEISSLHAPHSKNPATSINLWTDTQIMAVTNELRKFTPQPAPAGSNPDLTRISASQWETLQGHAKKHGCLVSKILAAYKVNRGSSLPAAAFGDITRRIEARDPAFMPDPPKAEVTISISMQADIEDELRRTGNNAIQYKTRYHVMQLDHLTEAQGAELLQELRGEPNAREPGEEG